MHPSLDANVVVPMFPHTLTSRPLVVPGDAEIRVVMGTAAAAPHVYCDSQVDYALQPGDEVVIVKHPRTLHLAYPWTTASFSPAAASSTGRAGSVTARSAKRRRLRGLGRPIHVPHDARVVGPELDKRPGVPIG